MMDDSQSEWLPSDGLRRWMLIGILAVFAAVCLNALAVAIELARAEEADGFSLTDILDFSVIVPDILILVGFLLVARETNRLNLWRSSIAYFGISWLFAPMILLSDGEWQGWEIIVGLAVIGGIVGLLVIVAQRPRAFAITAAKTTLTGDSDEGHSDTSHSDTSHSDTSHSDKGGLDKGGLDKGHLDTGRTKAIKTPKTAKSGRPGWGCGSAVFVLMALRVLSRMVRKMNAEWIEMIPLIGIGVLACCIVGFTVWFAIAKIQARHQLGSMAAISGVVDIFSIVGVLALLGFATWVASTAAMENVELDDRDPRLVMAIASISLLDILTTLTVGILFYSIMGRTKDPWDVQFEQRGRY